MIRKLVVLFFLISFESYSQCAMCKAIAESDPQGKESLFEGLNSGILYIALVYIYINRNKVL